MRRPTHPTDDGRPTGRPSESRLRATASTHPWDSRLPILTGCEARLRGLRQSDARSPLTPLSHPRVLEHLEPAPTTQDGFVRFIRWTEHQRRRRTHLCYGIAPRPG